MVEGVRYIDVARGIHGHTEWVRELVSKRALPAARYRHNVLVLRDRLYQCTAKALLGLVAIYRNKASDREHNHKRSRYQNRTPLSRCTTPAGFIVNIRSSTNAIQICHLEESNRVGIRYRHSL